MEDMKFNEVLELAKHAEQTINLQSNLSTHSINGDRKSKTKDRSSSGKHLSHSIEISREKLMPREKSFLIQNIQRGGGMIINKELRKKLEWIKWARKEGLCLRCAGKGHRITECTAGGSKPSAAENKGANLTTMLDRM